VERTQYTKKIGFTAIDGTLPTSGVEGSATPKTKTYLPAGYNHVYRTWEITAAANNIARFIFNVQVGDYQSPVFVVNNYTSSSLPTVVAKNGTAMTAGSDYVASLDVTGKKLWITLLGKVAGSNQIGINTSDFSSVDMPRYRLPSVKDVTNAKDKGLFDLTGKSLTAREIVGHFSGVILQVRDVDGLQKVKRVLR
jgi:hypothetical protein